MSRNQSRTCAERGAPAPRVRRPRHSPLERPLVVAILALSIALAGCLDGADGQITEPNDRGAPTDETVPEGPQVVHVYLEGNAFLNAPETINVGDTIIWTHRDDLLEPHTVTTTGDAPEAFDSSPTCDDLIVPVSEVCMTNGDTFSHTFTVEGTYQIHCKVHHSMSMTVTALAEPQAATAGGDTIDGVW